jgi:predicted transposase YbfD/YdcC
MAPNPKAASHLVTMAGLKFDKVRDWRKKRGLRHPLAGVLRLAVVALASGRRKLRDIEALAEDVKPAVLFALGLRRRISDTCLFNVLQNVGQVGQDGFRAELQDLVSGAMVRGDVRNDVLPFGFVVLDGKGLGGEVGTAPCDMARQSVCDANGKPFWDVFALRAVLASSVACPCLDQEVIDGKTGESPTFPTMIRRLERRFPGRIRCVSTDAGMTSEANALACRAEDWSYVFAVKGNQPRLLARAMELLEDATPEAFSHDREAGGDVYRSLRRCAAPADLDFPDATELWQVTRHGFTSRGEVEETRYFVTSLAPAKLNSVQKLLIVRRHWAIENNANWTMDMVFREDTHSPVNRRTGRITVGWLTLLAYNIVAIMRANAPLKDRKPPPWERVRQTILAALQGHPELWEEPVPTNV